MKHYFCCAALSCIIALFYEKQTIHFLIPPQLSFCWETTAPVNTKSRHASGKNAATFNTINIILPLPLLNANFNIGYWNNNKKDYYDKDILKVKVCYFSKDQASFPI